MSTFFVEVRNLSRIYGALNLKNVFKTSCLKQQQFLHVLKLTHRYVLFKLGICSHNSTSFMNCLKLFFGSYSCIFNLSYDVLTVITPTLLLFYYYILLLYLFILLSQGDNLLLTL